MFGDGSRGLKSSLGSSVRDESMEGFRRKIVAMSSLALLEKTPREARLRWLLVICVFNKEKQDVFTLSINTLLRGLQREDKCQVDV